MTIICSKEEKEWLEKLMAESNDCGLQLHCNFSDCKQCIDKNVKFIYNKDGEVVTCKDCKHNDEGTCYIDGLGVCDDYFCANGKRKEKLK